MSSDLDQLLEYGYFVLKNIIPSDLIDELTSITNKLLDEQSDQEIDEQKSTGSMIHISEDPFFANLISYKNVLDKLKRSGIYDLKFSSGYIISKPALSPPLFWHYDWAGWDHPFSWTKIPAQLFFMYYLVDTNVHNGCLRVIPKSHIEDNPLHDLLGDAHTSKLRQAKDLKLPEFQFQKGEKDIPVNAGDLVIGDSRLLHAAHSNNTNKRRTLITLWYHPWYKKIPGPLQGYISNMWKIPKDWPINDKQKIEGFRPIYTGKEKAVKFKRSRPKRLII